MCPPKPKAPPPPPPPPAAPPPPAETATAVSTNNAERSSRDTTRNRGISALRVGLSVPGAGGGAGVNIPS